eukprot:90780-Rhodomonas_salina.1
MGRSLVGCVRACVVRACTVYSAHCTLHTAHCTLHTAHQCEIQQQRRHTVTFMSYSTGTVSYTHLTLPTICSV